jgi:hypothetical protein
MEDLSGAPIGCTGLQNPPLIALKHERCKHNLGAGTSVASTVCLPLAGYATSRGCCSHAWNRAEEVIYSRLI